MKQSKEKIITYVLLNVLLCIYSVGSIFAKLASEYKVGTMNFFLYYGLMLFILVIYAVFWQQIIKKISITTACANKAVTVIWGMLFGSLFFKESIDVSNILGALLIIVGVYFVVTGEG